LTAVFDVYINGNGRKRMKRLFVFVALLAVAAAVGAQTLKDGFYFAEGDKFSSSGWKEQAVLEVKSGKIVKATWNGVSKLGVADKKTVSAAGGYGMIKVSKLKKEWHEQAAAVEAYLVQTQDVSFNKYKNAAGNTDAITGASMTVKDFFDLAAKAVAAGPVAKGNYAKDGWFFASAADFDKAGWKGNVLVTVVNGTIVDAVWNGISKDPKKKAKIIDSETGGYGMGKVAKQGEWHIQAARAADALVREQDPAKIVLKKDGKTDAVTGVSITVSEFYTLAAEALKAAR
jgi:major membrane immunogen (membrane-anchored lipoprotein)